MHRVTVYNYVLDSLDNILKNGIEYYNDKDKEIYNKLLMISEFIKDNSAIEEKVVEKRKNIEVPDNIQSLIDDYLDKISKINIEALNIEKSLYIKDNKEVKKEIVKEVNESIDIVVNNEYNTIQEKKEPIVPSRKSILNLFKW